MKIVPVQVATGVQALTMQIACPMYPQILGGVLWRYRPDQSPDGKVGAFTPAHPAIGFGSLANDKNCYFRVDGYVVHHDDKPPTPYEVVVTILADGQVIYSGVPEDGGTGTVGDRNQAFIFICQVLEAA